MTDAPCPTCGSTLGYYPGPNQVLRCSNCFHDTEIPSDPPEPSVMTQTQDKTVKARDKAVRGPKEQA